MMVKLLRDEEEDALEERQNESVLEDAALHHCERTDVETETHCAR